MACVGVEDVEAEVFVAAEVKRPPCRLLPVLCLRAAAFGRSAGNASIWVAVLPLQQSSSAYLPACRLVIPA